LAEEICAAGGTAEAAQVDALDEHAIEEHVGAVAQKAGTFDVSFNAIGIPQQNIQGVPLAELSAEAFSRPIMTYPISHFLTARAAARRMVEKGSGVILTLTATPARLASQLVGGMAPAWAAVADPHPNPGCGARATRRPRRLSPAGRDSRDPHDRGGLRCARQGDGGQV
jgi:NAD(P)-dependent dehydrogenase (short-subunit alcohol dehydrogenase family)